MATQKIDRNMLNTGIVDDSNATAITIDSSEHVVINKTNFSSLPTGSKLNIFGDGVTLRLDGTTSTTKSILFRGTNVANPGEVYADGSLRFRTEDASTRITFHTNSSGSNNERMRIDSSGNVGIGENTPANLLHVKVSDAGIAPHPSAQIVLERDGTNYLQFLTTAAGTSGLLFGDTNDIDVSKIYVDHNTTKMTFVNETIETMTLHGAKVGIGEHTPLGKLHVKEGDSGQGSINSNFDQLVLEDDAHSGMTILSGTSSDGAIYFGDSGGNNMGQFKYKHGTNSFTFATNNGNESLVIDSSGNVSMGQSFTSGANLHVEDTSDSMLLIYETGTSPYTATLKLASQSMANYGSNVQYTSQAEQLTIENYGRALSAASASGGIRFRTKVGNSSMTEVLSINGNTGQVIQPVQYYTTTYRGANQSVGAVTWTNWTFNSDLDNTGTNMRSADGVIKFPIAGLYLVTGLLSVESPAATNYNQFRAAFGGTANNSPIFLGINELVSGNDYGYDIPISFMVKIANTDTDLMYIQAFSGSGSLTIRGGTSSSHLNVRLLG